MGDEAAFWSATPRMFALALQAAGRRLKAESRTRRSELWWQAMLPHLKDPPSHKDFVGESDEPRPDMAAKDVRSVMNRWRHAVNGQAAAKDRRARNGR